MICLHHFVPFLIVLPENSSKTFICITKHSLSPLQVGLVIPFLPLAMVVVHRFTKSKVKFIIESVLSFPKMVFSPCSVSYMSMITTMPYIIEHKTIPSVTLGLWPRFKNTGVANLLAHAILEHPQLSPGRSPSVTYNVMIRGSHKINDTHVLLCSLRLSLQQHHRPPPPGPYDLEAIVRLPPLHATFLPTHDMHRLLPFVLAPMSPVPSGSIQISA